MYPFKKVFLVTLLFSFLYAFWITHLAFAGPQSTTYELKEYGFGSGGDSGIQSSTYSLFGTAGEIDNGKLDSSTYTTGNGLVFTVQANVPAAPTFTNPSNYYDRLKIVIDDGGNPTDAQFAIAISTDNFTTTNYVQSDNTVGSVLGSEDWQTYSSWGGATGFYVTGLLPNTAYKIKVSARQGNYTQSAWSSTATATTGTPALTFGVDSDSITFNNLSSGNSWTDASKSTVLTTSTNAQNGYTILAHETAPLTFNTSIPDYGSSNSSPSTWSGNGFGYTTDDSNLTGGTANRFTSGGPKYAGFTTTAPGDPVGDNTGPATSENFTVSYKVAATSTTPAGPYSTTIVYVVVPSY